MTNASWDQVKALFSAALEVSPAEREAFLTLEAGGDPALLAEVNSLLAAHDQPGLSLDTVTHEFRAQAFSPPSAAIARLGERIGAYRIVGVLGTGGMGDVFKAVRDDDQYRAEVAIKLMRSDVRSSLTEQRFRTERQILAGLDHRNIARLLDGGTAAGGVPYVVMELVAGKPIDQYCEARGASVRDRVRIFLEVCAAVSYAHQHLVVHRDLKPNNILVTADGSVKLLDFGIAKLVEADADTAVAEANKTETTMRAMTLDYASPEQVGGGTVTTVSDVYSLGVVLYRLLTGKSPYGVHTNDAQRVVEILSDTAPARPSLVQRTLDRDLDNILLMALRKEPQHRYGSVEQFANDLRNYLAGMPVRARGNSLRYRTGKFLRRRKVEVAAGVIVAGLLLGAMFFSLREARIAREHFDSVRKLANSMLFQVHDEMAKVPGSIKTREMLVNTSLEYLDSLYTGAGTDPALQEELAGAYRKVAEIQGSETSSSTGNYKGAIESYGRAIALLEPIVAGDPDRQGARVALARTYGDRARLVLVVNSPQDALPMARKGVALSEAVGPAMTDAAERAELFRSVYTTEGDVLFALHRQVEAMTSFDKVLAITEEYWRAHPEDENALFMLSRGFNSAAIHADARLSVPDADLRSIELLRRVMQADEKLNALDPASERYQRRLAGSRHNVARMLTAAGEHPEALRLFALAAKTAADRAADPNDGQAQYFSALLHSAYGRELLIARDIDEARRILLNCAAVLQRLKESNNTLRIEFAHGQNSVRVGQLYATLAEERGISAERRADLWRQARDSFQQGLASLEKVTKAVAIEPLDQVAVRDGVAGLAQAETALGELR